MLGGCRSGKSEVAERLAGPGPVTFLATGTAADDADMAARIQVHRRQRPASWVTVEVDTDLPGAVRAATGTVLVDALGTWVARAEAMAVDGPGLCAALTDRTGDTVVVSDEVGLGVHPSTDAGRRFRDALGALNRQVAEIADDVLLVVAGRVLRLEPGPP